MMRLILLKLGTNCCLLFLINIANWGKIHAQEKTKTKEITGFVDFNGYYDTRQFSVLTYNVLVNLPNRFQYFSLTNYESATNTFDLESNFAEHNIRWGLGQDIPLDITLQYVLRNGSNNDDIRLGFRWKVHQTTALNTFFKKINLSYTVNPMLVQLRKGIKTKYATQIEHVYALLIAPKALNKRLYLNGFIDQNMVYLNNGGLSFNWVTEHQLGYKLFNQLYAVIEYRINDYLVSDTNGLGYGLQYKMLF